MFVLVCVCSSVFVLMRDYGSVFKLVCVCSSVFVLMRDYGSVCL